MKRLFVLLLTFILILGLAACASEPEPVEPDEPEVDEEYDDAEDIDVAVGSDIHGAIHRIEYGNNVVYLFGTIHAYREGWTPLADVVEDAMQRADVFVAEISSEEMANMEAMMPEVMFLPDGQTWVDFLPEEAYNHLVEMAEAWELDYEMANTLNPAFLILMLNLEITTSFADDVLMGADTSIDAYVMRIAEERGLPTLGLESAEQQFDILYNPPFEVLVAQVMAFGTPEEVAEEIMYLGTLAVEAEWYETNNFLAFRDQSIRLFRDETEERLDLTHGREMLRNFRSTYYANEIARLLRETEEPTTFFVAVGITHIVRAMGGVEGLTDIVEQLGLQGFTAVPLWS